VDLVSAYPAILIGLGVGLVAAWRRWPITPILAAGAIAFMVLVMYQSTMPVASAELGDSSPASTAILVLLAIVNVGSWALGIGMGVAVAGLRRRPHPG
jgi:hypothetical protein